MVSEDSDELVPGLAMIHRLRNLSDLDQTLRGQVSTAVDDSHAPRKLLEVTLLRGPQRMLTEERDYRLHEIRAATNEVLAKVLSVIVVAPVQKDPSHTEEAFGALRGKRGCFPPA